MDVLCRLCNMLSARLLLPDSERLSPISRQADFWPTQGTFRELGGRVTVAKVVGGQESNRGWLEGQRVEHDRNAPELSVWWRLSDAELALLETKPPQTRLGFTAQLMMYRQTGRFVERVDIFPFEND